MIVYAFFAVAGGFANNSAKHVANANDELLGFNHI
jgi:hypothetical protein